MTDYQRLKYWLDENETLLAHFNTKEKGDIAIAAGQSKIAVSQWKTSMKFKEAV